MTREEWLLLRKKGIGASDASAVVGMNPYKTNVQLWEEKTGCREAEDISEKPYVKYGIDAERPLRELFALDYPQYIVEYDEFDMHYNEQYPFIFATLDGRLIERDESQKGILEIKTTEILRSMQYENWRDKIPDNYYCQVLHQFLATGFEFAVLKAQLKTVYGNGEIRLNTRHYHIERNEVLEDMEWLLQEEIKFWNCVERGIKPNLILPPI